METPKIELPGPKRYFSRVPGATYIFQDGHQIFFNHGRFDFDAADYAGTFLSGNEKHPLNGQVKWKVYQDELEHLVKTKNPLIFDQGNLPTDLQLPKELDPTRNAQSEASIQAIDATMRASRNIRETGDVNQSAQAGQVTDVNQSTVDITLQKAVLSPKMTGPGANSAVDAARAAAAARLATTAAAQNKNGMS